jgi:ComF family protein
MLGAKLGALAWRAALDLLYPPRCAGCDELVADREAVFCPPCALTLLPITGACPRCARPLTPPRERPPPCLACLQRPPQFNGAVAGFEFGGAIAEAIRRLKWGHMPELAPALGRMLDSAVERGPASLCAVDLIAPVPLHRRRLRRREFNQAALLAAAMLESAQARQATIAGVPLDARALVRTRDTPPQTGLTARQRRANVLDAFAVRNAALVRGRSVLLVDDVLTTGATADACALALKRAGASTVLVLTLGRAVT